MLKYVIGGEKMKKTIYSKNVSQITIRIPIELHKTLRRESANRGVSQNEIVKQALLQYFKQE